MPKKQLNNKILPQNWIKNDYYMSPIHNMVINFDKLSTSQLKITNHTLLSNELSCFSV